VSLTTSFSVVDRRCQPLLSKPKRNTFVENYLLTELKEIKTGLKKLDFLHGTNDNIYALIHKCPRRDSNPQPNG
jgi:hypothetical protein